MPYIIHFVHARAFTQYKKKLKKNTYILINADTGKSRDEEERGIASDWNYKGYHIELRLSWGQKPSKHRQKSLFVGADQPDTECCCWLFSF